jgi:hypothetical protein
MYAKIVNSVAVEYPVFEGQLEERHPDRTYPLDISGDPIPEGYVRVKPFQPAESPTEIRYKYVMAMPKLIDGEWTESYDKVERSAEELSLANESLSAQVRIDRDKLLKHSDNRIRSDVWDKYTDQEKAEWADYRQALKDIPDQPGFPTDVEWPLEPSTFAVKII